MSKTSVDLLLVNPGGHRRIYQNLSTHLSAIEPPVWAGLIATFIRRQGFTVQILDANAEGLDAEAAADRIHTMQPRLTAVVAYGHNPSASTQVMPAVRAICTAVKQRAPEVPIVLVGGHVAALPERTLREEAADFVCDGEGCYTIQDLLHALTSSSAADISKVRGLWYRDGQSLRYTMPAPFVENLAVGMPGIAWDLLPMANYRAHNWHCFGQPARQPYAALYTTLGCPYHCQFCCIQAPFRAGEQVAGYRPEVHSYRRWSPQAVLAEIDTLVTHYGISNLKIADEMFVLHPQHVLDICDGIIARGYHLNIWAYARVDTVTDAMLARLKQAGFNWLAFGIETASPQVRAAVQKGFAQETIFRALEKVRAAGIYLAANYIFGLPEDTLETMQATLDLALAINSEWANFSCAMAYPGSQLYIQATQQGWALPAQWSGYSQYAADTLPLPTRTLTAAEVLDFRDRAFYEYYKQPSYLSLMMRQFGADIAQPLQEMTAEQLVRLHGKV